MANVTSIKILQDGPRNTRIKLEGILDTTDLTYTVLILPSSLSDVGPTGYKASQLRIDKIDYDIQDNTSVRVYWDNSTPANADRVWELTGRGMVDNCKYQDLNNTKAAGFTGGIAVDTKTYSGTISAANPSQFTIIFTLVKQ
jgi:hypothetical protein